MASFRRSKTMLADGQTARFLYAIIKQLDLKSVDWSLVASQLEISNGHAARMRFSRFRQHMEGTQRTPRSPRARKNNARNNNGKSGKGCDTKMKGKDLVKGEPSTETPARVKEEESGEPSDPPLSFGVNATTNTDMFPTPTFAASTTAFSFVKPEPDPLLSVMMSGLPGPGFSYQYPDPPAFAPSDLTLQDPALEFSPHEHIPFLAPELQPYNNLWGPVKLESNEDGCMDDFWVKTETREP